VRNLRERSLAEPAKHSGRDAPARKRTDPENPVLAARGLSFDGLGNRARVALLRSGRLQRQADASRPGEPREDAADRPSGRAKLEIGPVDDPFEREADRVAEQVMRMPDPVKPTREQGAVRLQRACACGGLAGMEGECEQCRQSGTRLQRQPASPDHSAGAPPIVHEVLRSPGQPLDPATRAFMEPRF
jgi:hypothetical protein